MDSSPALLNFIWSAFLIAIAFIDASEVVEPLGW